tara:strand:+ start:16653 stop:17024 length:372 start_codon:yes stop_codon:yes gene_type:complete
MAGVVHHSNFIRYFEATEADLLRSVDLSLHDPEQRWMWPRVKYACKYLAPVTFEDEIEISICVKHVGRSSIHYEGHIHRLGAEGVIKAVEAEWVVVCTEVQNSSGRRVSREVPEVFRRLLPPI